MTKRKNSRSKGAVGERGWSHFLQAQGFAARRGVQYSGGPDSPDVVHEDERISYLHAEVKRVERGLCLYQATEQAADEAPVGKLPYVAHRKNRKGWLVTMRAEDWIQAVEDKDEAPVRVLLVDLPTASPTELSTVSVAARMHGAAPCLLAAAWIATGEPVDLDKLGAARRFFIYERISEAMRSGPLVDDLSGPVK